ncbi:MAG: alpha/beta hydrolase [Methylobacteriaceae bacterium]|nr:alpha/beta hydrolase [Methylobacteriaceae bacterium]
MFLPAGESMQPADAGLPQAEPLDIRTLDGERLRVWHIAPKPGRAVFLYFHGNAGSLADRAATFRALTARGDGLLALSYRGYPGSTGSPSEDGLARDADALYAQAQAMGYGGPRLVFVGESLGAGVAVPLAARRAVAALILDAPFVSAVELAAEHYWMFPVRLLMRDPFRTDLALAAVRAPALILHGARDPVTPVAHGRRLFALAREPKRFIEIAEGGHLVLDRAMTQALDWTEQAIRR